MILNINSVQRKNNNDIGDPRDIDLMPSAGQNFHLLRLKCLNKYKAAFCEIQ